MTHFADQLIAEIKKKNSVVCVGLDPVEEKLPKEILEKHENLADAFIEFDKGILDAVKDHVVAVKPQLAYYEVLGHEGIRAFEESCAYARKLGLLVIADGKRNDIGSTAEAYAKAYLGRGTADALTVNGYLGFDGVQPFLTACREHGKGIFILVRTSNPSSGDIQDRSLQDENMRIAELMAHFVESWGDDLVGESGYSSVGAVVGATYPKEVANLRKLMPHAIFLLPGFGAQGATAEDTSSAFDKDGLGALVVSARGIIYAENPELSAIQMKEELNRVR